MSTNYSNTVFASSKYLIDCYFYIVKGISCKIIVDIVRGTWELENVGGPYSLGFKNLEAIPTNICVLKVISIFCGVRASKFLAIVSSYLFFKCPYDIEGNI